MSCVSISIIDYGMGNIQSIKNALAYLNIPHQVINTPEQILESNRLILPGVGSFFKAMELIKQKNLIDALTTMVLDRQIPILGICLGMQLFATFSEEDGVSDGLNWIPSAVVKLSGIPFKVPHVGFNTVHFTNPISPLFQGIGVLSDFYFIHSYHMQCHNPQVITGWVEYGGKWVASVQYGNIFGTQFHPEKSQGNGLFILKNFSQLLIL